MVDAKGKVDVFEWGELRGTIAETMASIQDPKERDRAIFELLNIQAQVAVRKKLYRS